MTAIVLLTMVHLLVPGTRASVAASSASAAEFSPIIQAINAFDLAQAEALLDRRKSRDDAVGLYYRTRLQVLTGALAEAGETADRCLNQWPDNTLCHEAKGEWAMVNLVIQGNVFKQLGDSRKAREHLESAVSLDPDNLRARMLLVRYYSLAPWFAGGSSRKARAQVSQCEQRDAFWGHEAAALLALAEKRFEDAVDRFRKAQALQPDDRDPAFYLAKAYSQSGETGAAIEVLERLVERYPRFHDGWLELGKLAAEQGLASPRGTAALEYFLANEPDAPPKKRAAANLYLGQLHAAAGRSDQAANAYAAALAASPDFSAARRTLRAHCRSYPEATACR